jgi:hypothetical protein
MNQKMLLAVTPFPNFTVCFFGCNQPASNTEMIADDGLSSDSDISYAQQAYIYEYLMLMMDDTKKISPNVAAPIPDKPITPVNQFGHFRTFPDADFKDVVKPNCGTYNSLAWLDLASEPLVLSVPNTNGRYYLLPMLDAYTNVSASPAKRTTATEAGNFFNTGPGFTGAIPAGMTEIKAPANMVWILGRTQTNSKQDGVLDNFIQYENPGEDKKANWLPTGKEGFSLTMRIYWPKGSLMNGSWKIPPVRVVP